jgi:hypothetical protein
MRAISFKFYPGGGWLRVFGRGFAWKDLRQHSLMFSERYGYRKTWRIGHYSFAWLGA